MLKVTNISSSQLSGMDPGHGHDAQLGGGQTVVGEASLTVIVGLGLLHKQPHQVRHCLHVRRLMTTNQDLNSIHTALEQGSFGYMTFATRQLATSIYKKH